MRKLSLHFFMISAFCMTICATAAHAASRASDYGNMPDPVGYDTENPLFFEGSGDILSRTTVDYGNSILAARQRFSVGLAGRFSLNGEINLQNDFDGPLDGVSYTGIGGAYRVRDDSIVTDFLAGVKFGGHAATPEYEDVVYSVGARMGKQWSWLTIAATLQSSWIFHDTHGLAYIDLSPEVYMRVFSSWRLGAYGMLRKATNPDLDAEAMGGKVAAIYGRTMYVGFAQYEFSHSELRFGGRINILF